MAARIVLTVSIGQSVKQMLYCYLVRFLVLLNQYFQHKFMIALSWYLCEYYYYGVRYQPHVVIKNI
jgi:hypothetical protein